MKTNVIKKEGRKVIELNFNYNEGETQKSIAITLQEPGWEETIEAFKCLTDATGEIDMLTPGKFIFDTCVLEYTDGIYENIRLMMSICSQLTSKFILPINATLEEKKNNID